MKLLALLLALAAALAPNASVTSRVDPVAWGYPIGLPGRPRGDGFFIRHVYSAENTWYNPGYWHTGEDWYALDGDTAGAEVYAVAAGNVVYAGANYPGRVVIVEQAGGLFAMYGHLDPALRVKVGQLVAAGDLLGTVLRRGDKTPNHLHFEMRTFLLTGPVNGTRPRYAFRCGVRCPPGPGYWPSRAPDHPGALGWRNPTHVINRAAFAGTSAAAPGAVVVVARPAEASTTLWSAPPGDRARRAIDRLQLTAGDRYAVPQAWIGPDDTRGFSAEAYAVWYKLALAGGSTGWVRAAVPSTFETGADGRPSSVRFNFVPAS